MARRILVPWGMPEIGREILRKSKAEVAFLHGPKGEIPSLKELTEAVRHADVLIPRGTQPVTKKVMMANPNLRGIANYGVGYDNIDVASATELGIPVTNTPGVLTETTADLAWALLMATARWIPQAHNYTLSGEWKTVGGRTFMGLDIGPGGSNRPKVLGIIGFGRIGQAVARRSRGFKMKVIAYDPPVKPLIEKTKGVSYSDLDDLLRESDFVSIHCPLTQETHHLIGKRELDLMKSTAILINTARGPVVDEKALVGALKQKKIAAAGLDVYEKEPKLTPGLTKLENAVVLPHIGSATNDTRGQMAVVAAKNALAMLQGKRPKNIVNPQVLEASEYLRRTGK
ncbi:MAG TPA: D-glycerate dehydrogenase [Thermodesulfobacteriota bacterium]|nr:D-glycerate dehydrogenase [Thermodesulfobacteriota bacterium]